MSPEAEMVSSDGIVSPWTEGPTAAQRFSAEARRRRLMRGITQAQAAEAVSVSRVTIAQWEAGKYLPSLEHARLLDTYLDAGRVLVALVERARRSSRPKTSSVIGEGSDRAKLVTFSAAQVFAKVASALVDHLILDENGDPVGWRHNVREAQTGRRDKHATALSTAYGIKTLLSVDGPLLNWRAVETSLLDAQLPTGGWGSHSRQFVRPESTAIVLDALYRIGTSLSVEVALKMLEDSLDKASRARPYILSTVLQTSLRFRPNAPLNTTLIDALLKSRSTFNGLQLWPELAEPGRAFQEPSAVHTARAVVALQAALPSHDRADLREAIDQGVEWLAGRNTSYATTIEEFVVHSDSEDPDAEDTVLLFRHFTAAWVVQALIGSIHDVPVGRARDALALMWTRYDHNVGLWAWTNGDLPIWMTHDAVIALRDFCWAAPVLD